MGHTRQFAIFSCVLICNLVLCILSSVNSQDTPTTYCRWDMTRCTNGQCVTKIFLCDGDDDCEDASDEKSCLDNTCDPGRYKCKSGHCTAADKVCDGNQDCKDGSDETSCGECSNDAVLCDNSLCISQSQLCDYHFDCADKSDEANCSDIMAQPTWQETWIGHHQTLQRVVLNDHVAVYNDPDVNQTIQLPIESISKAWKYVKESYGSFDPNSLLYVVRHDTKYPGCQAGVHTKDGYRNVIYCAVDPTASIENSFVFQNFTSTLARLIQSSVNRIENNADKEICSYNMSEIVSYDIHLHLQNSDETMLSWTSNIQNMSKIGRHCFDDWYLPIYKTYGGTKVLTNFYNLTYAYFPKTKKSYDRVLNLGEFVHFWSGSAGVDLEYLSNKAFNWTKENHKELIKARKTFDSFSYDKTCSMDQITCNNDECIPANWRCDAIQDCIDGSDETNCSECSSDVFKCQGGGCVRSSSVCDVHPDYVLTAVTRSTAQKLFPKSIMETWHYGSNRNLYRVYQDENLAVYSEAKMRKSINWLIAPVSRAWKYVKDTYGSFGPKHLLYIALHYNSYSWCQESSFIDEKHGFRNFIDCGMLRSKSWEVNYDDNFETFLYSLATVIRKGAKGILNDADLTICESKLQDILLYDIYLYLNGPMSAEAEKWKTKRISAEDESSGQSPCFTKWFLPIYERYGGASVINNYLTLMSMYWERDSSSEYSKLGIPDIVLFWSQAASADLIPLAKESFFWTKGAKQQLAEAKINNPMFNYTGGFFNEQPTKSKDGSSPLAIIAVVSAVIVLILICIAIGWKFVSDHRKIQTLSQQIRNLTAEEVEEFTTGSSVGSSALHSPIHCMPFNNIYEIPKERLQVDEEKLLGSGEFGLVKPGILSGDIKVGTADAVVAVKMVKQNVEISYFKAMLSEIKIMAYLGAHENIASLLGTVTSNIKNRQVYVALEFCAKGDLLGYLKAGRDNFANLWTTTASSLNSPNIHLQDSKVTIDHCDSKAVVNLKNVDHISTLELVTWSHQISSGMEYLNLKRVIHGDLAARNVLLTSANVAKISDFGLSRQLINYSNYLKTSTTPLPWRWLALESLTDQAFSAHSDIWAYGVTLWEIFTLGKLPYPGRTWNRDFIAELTSGQRLDSPEFGNEEIYSLMLNCMKEVDTERIAFSQIKSQLGNLKERLAPATTSSFVDSSLYMTCEEV